jgi:hypothetical protein
MRTVMNLPRSRPLTKADLADRPDDGHRYELASVAVADGFVAELPCAVTVVPDELVHPGLPL